MLRAPLPSEEPAIVVIALVLPTVLTAVVEQHDALQLQEWRPSEGIGLSMVVRGRRPFAPQWTQLLVDLDSLWHLLAATQIRSFY